MAPALVALLLLGLAHGLRDEDIGASLSADMDEVTSHSMERHIAAHSFHANASAVFCCNWGDSCSSCTSPSKPGEWCTLSKENCKKCNGFFCDGTSAGPSDGKSPGPSPGPPPDSGPPAEADDGSSTPNEPEKDEDKGETEAGAETSNSGDRCDSKETPLHSKCTGCPPKYNGKLCASTTRYNDMTKAACGCGEADPVPKDWWTLTNYTLALNCKNLDPDSPLLSWCPHGCGGCFELCSTGGTANGKTTKAGVCQVFTVTNRCGDGYKEYPEWCSQELTYQECEKDPAKCKKKGSTNKYGYPAHFDLQDYHLQVSKGLGWDNIEVTFEPVSCSRWKGSGRDTCQCKMVDTGDWYRGSGGSRS